jgi:DNA-binding transcriptional ArsR family regulator
MSDSAIVRSSRNGELQAGLSEARHESVHRVSAALADPTRRAIFEELTRQGEQTVHALTRYTGVS